MSKPVPGKIDQGIAREVRIMQAAGIETFESCEGGPGHAYLEPTVRFHGTPEAGWRAQARNAVIGCLLDFAAGEACRIARREGRDPDPAKWLKTTQDAFERAVIRTMAQPPSPQPDPEAR